MPQQYHEITLIELDRISIGLNLAYERVLEGFFPFLFKIIKQKALILNTIRINLIV